VHRIFVTIAVALVVALFGQRTAAQGLTASLFERYLESLREQAGIPGMSALVLQQGVVQWEHGFGRADIDSALRAEPDTPYLIGDLSQTFGATLLLKKCIDESFVTLNDRIDAWVPGFPEPATTLAQLLAHVAPNGSFKYDTGRFAILTPVIEDCADARYRKLLDEEIFEPFAMVGSAPGTASAVPSLEDRTLFDERRLAHLGSVVRRLATPYSVDAQGRATRTALPPAGVNASEGIVSTVRDLASFDARLRRDFLLEPLTLQRAWTRVSPSLPTGLGWFVQDYNGTRIVWQFGIVQNAYSSLIVKVPDRELTFILLANSDKLSAPFALENGDVNNSVFARLFLRLYLP
jgi:CubicO group peptidase (beta-lactamase class C family)